VEEEENEDVDYIGYWHWQAPTIPHTYARQSCHLHNCITEIGEENLGCIRSHEGPTQDTVLPSLELAHIMVWMTTLSGCREIEGQDFLMQEPIPHVIDPVVSFLGRLRLIVAADEASN
jgi:hypothetical protein